MGKKILSGLFALALLATAGYGGQKSLKSNAGLNDLALANVEALADGEINPDCPNGCVKGAGGCFCYEYYPHFKEYDWDKKDID